MFSGTHNPNFDSYTGNKEKCIKVLAVIANDLTMWHESFTVTCIGKAAGEIKEVIDYYNATCIRPGDKKRKYVELVGLITGGKA